MSALRWDGKPLRVLRILRDTSPAHPLTEYDVYRLDTPKGVTDTSRYHAALKTLVDRGLAKRCGIPRGYQWYITDEGRAELARQAS